MQLLIICHREKYQRVDLDEYANMTTELTELRGKQVDIDTVQAKLAGAEAAMLDLEAQATKMLAEKDKVFIIFFFYPGTIFARVLQCNMWR